MDKLKVRFGKEARVYESYTELVQDPELDWVFIGSWNSFHREHAVAAAKAGGIDEAMETGQVVDMKSYWDKAGIEE